MDARFPLLPHSVDAHASVDWRDGVAPAHIGTVNGIRYEAERAGDRAAEALSKNSTIIALAACTALAIAAVTAITELSRLDAMFATACGV